MARTQDDPDAEPILLHWAARMEDWIHRVRERLGRRRGLVTTIIPYTGYGAPGWARLLCRVVLSRGEAARSRAEKVRGWRSFLSIPVDDEVIARVGDHEFRMRPDRAGIVDDVVEVDLPPGWHTVVLHTEGTDPVTAGLFIVDPAAEFGIISDVDDTVMVTALPRPFLAAWNTFVLDEHARTPVAGMSVLYDRLSSANPGAPVIYLSTGAWNVAPTLSRFMGRNLYPRGPLLLTDWGPTHDRWFRSGREHKKSSLERIAGEFPGMRWLLVGDDGQHDEEIYREFARAHPENVAAVAIRQLSPGEAVLAGGRSRPGDHQTEGVPWFYAPDGAGLVEQFRAAGILRES